MNNIVSALWILNWIGDAERDIWEEKDEQESDYLCCNILHIMHHPYSCLLPKCKEIGVYKMTF